MGIAVRTEAIPDPGPLLRLVDTRHPLAFVRGGDGIVGVGEAVRLTFTGPHRIREAADAWRTICASASVDDAVRLPGTGLVGMGSFAFADDSGAESVLIVPATVHGRRDGVAWLTRVEGDLDFARSQDARRSSDVETTPVTFEPGAFPAHAYALAVANAVERIHAGELSKVVLARDLVGELPEPDLGTPLARLAQRYADAVTFAIEGLIGATPETLVRVEGGEVTARVLAGTAPPGDGGGDALLASHKDRDEHGLARASVVAALRPHTTDLGGGEPYALELPNLWHIASDIRGRLGDDASALDLVAALHPTAAVGGTPTDVAVHAIAELEPFDRGRYAGPVGWIDADGSGEWAIALRCAVVADGRVTAYAGAGIVADSSPANEVAETELKFRPILEAFS